VEGSLVLRFSLTTGVLLLVICGCGYGRKVAPVSGVVTLNGKPIADVAVTFEPIVPEGQSIAGLSAFGVTGADGRYSLKLYGTETRGATVGKNRVKFTGFTAPTDMSEEALNKAARSKVNIPIRYWGDSKIECDVPAGGTDKADFQLTSP
jgi:hypothetical protein